MTSIPTAITTSSLLQLPIGQPSWAQGSVLPPAFVRLNCTGNILPESFRILMTGHTQGWP